MIEWPRNDLWLFRQAVISDSGQPSESVTLMGGEPSDDLVAKGDRSGGGEIRLSLELPAGECGLPGERLRAFAMAATAAAIWWWFGASGWWWWEVAAWEAAAAAAYAAACGKTWLVHSTSFLNSSMSLFSLARRFWNHVMTWNKIRI